MKKTGPDFQKSLADMLKRPKNPKPRVLKPKKPIQKVYEDGSAGRGMPEIMFPPRPPKPPRSLSRAKQYPI